MLEQQQFYLFQQLNQIHQHQFLIHVHLDFLFYYIYYKYVSATIAGAIRLQGPHHLAV